MENKARSQAHPEPPGRPDVEAVVRSHSEEIARLRELLTSLESGRGGVSPEPVSDYALRRSTSTVSSKGQITIPKQVRMHYRLEPGAEVEFELRDEGALIRRRRPERHPAWSVIGSLKKKWQWPKGIPHTVDAYIDYVRGGSYEELTGAKRPPKSRP